MLPKLFVAYDFEIGGNPSEVIDEALREVRCGDNKTVNRWRHKKLIQSRTGHEDPHHHHRFTR